MDTPCTVHAGYAWAWANVDGTGGLVVTPPPTRLGAMVVELGDVGVGVRPRGQRLRINGGGCAMREECGIGYNPPSPRDALLLHEWSCGGGKEESGQDCFVHPRAL